MSLDALTQAALMGTSRQPAPDVHLPGALPAPPADAGPERRLLRAAAVMRVYRDAGERPARVTALPDPAPGEPRPVCPPAACAHLTVILGTYPDLLDEWLAALAAAGMLIPAAHIRALLDLAAGDPQLALALEPVLSERARWLAAQHAPWAWAAGSDPHQRWQTGTRAEREHVLSVCRAGDPQLARELIASTWAEDPARDRETFLRALRPRLDASDEAFLEGALDDRSVAVRRQAAALLSALPASAFAERMRRRAGELVDTGRRTLHVQLAGELTPELARDGVNDTPPQGTGPRRVDHQPDHQPHTTGRVGAAPSTPPPSCSAGASPTAWANCCATRGRPPPPANSTRAGRPRYWTVTSTSASRASS